MVNKLYIVRKYILAKSLKEEIAKEKKTMVDEIWIDEDWKRNQGDNNIAKSIGYHSYGKQRTE